jgi:hypothetical protein
MLDLGIAFFTLCHGLGIVSSLSLSSFTEKVDTALALAPRTPDPALTDAVASKVERISTHMAQVSEWLRQNAGQVAGLPEAAR